MALIGEDPGIGRSAQPDVPEKLEGRRGEMDDQAVDYVHIRLVKIYFKVAGYQLSVSASSPGAKQY